MIPGHVPEKNARNLYTFFSFLFQQKILQTRSLVRASLYDPRILCSTLFRAAMLIALFPAVPTKTMVHVVALTIVSCKGSVCVEVLSCFYGRFFVDEWQFIKYTPFTSSHHLGNHFFHLLTPPRFGALNLPEVNQFTGNCFHMVRIVLKITFLKLRYPKTLY